MHWYYWKCKTTPNRPCKDIQIWPFNFQVLVASATLFLLTPLGRVLCWHLGTSSSPPAHKALAKGFRKGWQGKVHHGHLSAQFSQLMFQKVLNICVLLHGPPFGHLKSSAFQPKPFQIILGSVVPQYWNWKQKSGHTAWDYCRRQNSMAAAPFLYSCTSAFGISKLFTHQNSLKSVHSH